MPASSKARKRSAKAQTWWQYPLGVAHSSMLRSSHDWVTYDPTIAAVSPRHEHVLLPEMGLVSEGQHSFRKLVHLSGAKPRVLGRVLDEARVVTPIAIEAVAVVALLTALRSIQEACRQLLRGGRQASRSPFSRAAHGHGRLGSLSFPAPAAAPLPPPGLVCRRCRSAAAQGRGEHSPEAERQKWRQNLPRIRHSRCLTSLTRARSLGHTHSLTHLHHVFLSGWVLRTINPESLLQPSLRLRASSIPRLMHELPGLTSELATTSESDPTV
mmetsp:Transcript_34509/g.83946  ORF Transcript_34509/g.83946 Transcript_34509/m.83946 type:complete len:270 (+) Transcript_34509:221-1030(+)